MGYVQGLVDAGLDVVADPFWFDRGTPLADAGEVTVEFQDHADDGAEAIDAAKAAQAHAFIRRDGTVWLLAAATAEDAPRVRVVVAATEDGKGKPTRKQQDALDVVLSMLDGEAAAAVAPDEPIHAERAEEG